MAHERDPGDAVPPGVAPQNPPPPTGNDKEVKDKLERMTDKSSDDRKTKGSHPDEAATD